MISPIENKLSTNRRRVVLRILAFGLLFLVLTVNGFAQESNEENAGLFSQLFKKKPSSSSSDSSSSSNSFHPSSWFRKSDTAKTETPKSASTSNSPQNNTQNNTAKNNTSTVTKPAAAATVPGKEPRVEYTPSKMLDDFSSDINIAPLPPDHPYYERNRAVAPEVNAANAGTYRQPVSLADSMQLPVTDTVPHQFNEKSSDEPMIGGLSSYSFDTRDWVESFPVEHVTGLDSYSTNQSAPLHAAHQTIAASPSLVVASQWDGHATPLLGTEPVIPAEEFPKVASASHSVIDSVKRTDAAQPKIDLSPSYTARLKYAEVYGVVVVQSNFPLTEVKSVLDEIRQLQVDLNLYMGVPAPKEKIELCLFRDEKTYLKFLQEVFPKAPHDRRALYIKIDNKPGTLLVQKTDEFEVDLRHEMTHAIIHASIANVPIWLDEGLAKYFEVPIADRAEKNPYMKPIRRYTRFGAVPTLGRLEKLDNITQMGSREYRDSWAWVHFLIHHSPQTHRLLAGYLQLLSTLPPDQDSVKIPQIGPYLEDTVKNPREKYREHFQDKKTEDN